MSCRPASGAQFRRRHHNPEEQRRRATEWTDEQLVAYVRELRAARGGVLRTGHLREDRPGRRGGVPAAGALQSLSQDSALSCTNCGLRVQLKAGAIRRHHFAHWDAPEAECYDDYGEPDGPEH